eukprot:SAG11_NODE_88_length_17244_cov_17.187460_11_plen_110_part_00
MREEIGANRTAGSSLSHTQRQWWQAPSARGVRSPPCSAHDPRACQSFVRRYMENDSVEQDHRGDVKVNSRAGFRNAPNIEDTLTKPAAAVGCGGQHANSIATRLLLLAD